jgi:septin family protein
MVRPVPGYSCDANATCQVTEKINSDAEPGAQSVEAVVDSPVSPEMQEILNEVEQELNEELSGALKKTIKSRLKKIREMERELQKEKAALASLLQARPAELDVLKQNPAILLSSSDMNAEIALENWKQQMGCPF